MTVRHREVVVIGGGQAGLAVGHHLARHERDFTILEAADALAAAWRDRWDSLRLFTPARFDGLPGAPFPGDPDRYPTRDEVVASRVGRRLKAGDTLIGSSPRRARSHGITLHPRATAAGGTIVNFADRGALEVPTVIWATGFASDHSWIDVPVFGASGAVLQTRGVTPADGLYFVGLAWMHTRGSALLGWVKHDAAYIAGQIAAGARASAPVTIVER